MLFISLGELNSQALFISYLKIWHQNGHNNSSCFVLCVQVPVGPGELDVL